MRPEGRTAHNDSSSTAETISGSQGESGPITAAIRGGLHRSAVRHGGHMLRPTTIHSHFHTYATFRVNNYSNAVCCWDISHTHTERTWVTMRDWTDDLLGVRQRHLTLFHSITKWFIGGFSDTFLDCLVAKYSWYQNWKSSQVGKKLISQIRNHNFVTQPHRFKLL